MNSYWDSNSNKFYVKIIYIMDFLVMKKCNQYLRPNSFRIPLLISVYFLMSITAGHANLNQKYLWSIFQKFIRFYRLLDEDELRRVRIQAQLCEN